MIVSSGRREPTRPVSSEAPASAYSWYVLGVLVVVYILNFIDRQILSILAVDIKRDLALTDGQLGFLGGAAFAKQEEQQQATAFSMTASEDNAMAPQLDSPSRWVEPELLRTLKIGWEELLRCQQNCAEY